MAQKLYVAKIFGFPNKLTFKNSILTDSFGEAKELLEKFDVERRAWFRKIADTEPEDQNLYDLVIESDNIFNEDKYVRKIITAIAQ